MTKSQRLREEVMLIKKNNVLGAGRTAALTALKNKYDLSEDMLRTRCLHVPGCDYWN